MIDPWHKVASPRNEVGELRDKIELWLAWQRVQKEIMSGGLVSGGDVREKVTYF